MSSAYLVESAGHLEPVQCPLCVGSSHKLLAEYENKALLKCLHCGASYLFPQPQPQDLSAHFEAKSRLDEDELKRKFEVNRQRVLSRVAGEIQRRRRQGSILDVGCATGIFLDRFFAPSAWDRCGVDLSAAAVERVSNNGIRACCGEVRDGHFPQSAYDVITVLDAFYYFPNPQMELAEFRRILKDDGLLVLELPLATSRIWRTSGRVGRSLSGSKQALLQSSDHLFYFTPKSISFLLRRCGFALEKVAPLPGNRQPTLLRDLGMRAYYGASVALAALSFSRIIFAPRFLVIATKAKRLEPA